MPTRTPGPVIAPAPTTATSAVQPPTAPTTVPGGAPVGPTPPHSTKVTKGKAKKAMDDFRKGRSEYGRDKLSPGMPHGLFKESKHRNLKAIKNRAQEKEKNRQLAAERWNKVKERAQKDNDYASYNDFSAILMKMVTVGVEFAEALHASASASLLSSLYPRTVKDVLLAPLKPFYKPLQFPSAVLKEKLWDDRLGMAKTLKGKIELSMDDKGVFSSTFKVHDQVVKDQDFMDNFDVLVYGYLETKGYDIDTTNLDGPKIVYGSGPDKGKVISSDDFKALMKDDYKDLRDFMEKVARNKETPLPS